MRHLGTIACLTLATCLVSCDSSTGISDALQLKVQNTAATTLAIQVGSTNFGAIEAGATSPYRTIQEGVLTVRIDGVEKGTQDFCVGELCLASPSSWTAEFDEDGIHSVVLDGAF
jgi:hypothetical protein